MRPTLLILLGVLCVALLLPPAASRAAMADATGAAAPVACPSNGAGCDALPASSGHQCCATGTDAAPDAQNCALPGCAALASGTSALVWARTGQRIAFARAGPVLLPRRGGDGPDRPPGRCATA